MNNVFQKLMRTVLTVGIIMAFFCFTGCGNGEDSQKVVLMTGFQKDEVFRIESASCTLPEIMLYLTNIQNQYEKVYGAEIWNRDLDGVSLEENVKEIVLAKVAQIKTMNLLADDYQVFLDEDENKKTEQAAGEYFSLLTEQEKELTGIDLDTIRMMYQEYARADKVYRFLIKDINPEISDDEARTITVQHILIKTYAKDGTGTRIEYSE